MRFIAEIFISEPCLVKSACGSAAEIAAYQRVGAVHRKRFLRKKYLTACHILYAFQYLTVASEIAFFCDIARGIYLVYIKSRCVHILLQSISSSMR